MDKVRINKFLDYWRQIIIENPNIDFNDPKMQKEIYHTLIRLGVENKEQRSDIDALFFKKWIKDFQNIENVQVFVDPNWNYFCQFINGPQIKNHIKIYIPIRFDHLDESAKLIFNFLAKNNIAHHSKIGREIRFDNIVVRLHNESDARKLISFIHSNKYINEGLIQANPFALSVNNLAIASDGRLSYNSIISSFLRIYFDYIKRNNLINQISADGFIQFIKNYYQEKFIEKQNTQEIFNHFDLETNYKGAQYVPTINFINLKNITELIIKTSNPHFSFNDFISFFQQITNPNYIMEEESEFEPIVASHNNVSQKNNQIDDEQEYERRLLEIIFVHTNKHNYTDALYRIQSLLSTNNYEFITRDYSLRFRLMNMNFANGLRNILTKYHLSLNDYIQIISEDITKFEFLIRDYIITMTNKYDRECALKNLEYYFITGNPALITRENNIRNLITSIKFKEEFQNILKIIHMNIEQYFNYIETKYGLSGQINNNRTK